MYEKTPKRPGQAQDKLLRVGLAVGVGPAAALPSALVGVLAWELGPNLGLPPISAQAELLANLGWLGLGLGCLLLLWALASLPPQQAGRRLCTHGAYRYLRHPQYAALICCVAPGLALLANSFPLLAWAALQLPLWRPLIKREDLTLEAGFGQAWRDYAARTGSLWPRLMSGTRQD